MYDTILFLSLQDYQTPFIDIIRQTLGPDRFVEATEDNYKLLYQFVREEMGKLIEADESEEVTDTEVQVTLCDDDATQQHRSDLTYNACTLTTGYNRFHNVGFSVRSSLLLSLELEYQRRRRMLLIKTIVTQTQLPLVSVDRRFASCIYCWLHLSISKSITFGSWSCLNLCNLGTTYGQLMPHVRLSSKCLKHRRVDC